MGRRRWARRLPGSAGGRDARRPVGRNRAARRGGGGAADTPGVDGINNGGTGGGPGTSGAPGGQELRADRPVSAATAARVQAPAMCAVAVVAVPSLREQPG